MKLILPIISSICLLLSASCESAKKQEVVDVKVEKADTVNLAYAKCFRIINLKNSKTLEILDSEKDFEVTFKYTVLSDSKDFKNDVNSSTIISPTKRTIALSSTHIGMMNNLDLTKTLVGISSKDYLCSNVVKEMVESKEIEEVQDISFANFEKYVSVSPDLIIYSGFNNEAPLLDKLHQANLVTLANYDWKEVHPLGRAEWIKVFGLLYDKVDEANAIFEQEVLKYNQLKSSVAQIKNNTTIVSGSVWGDFWNAPAGESYMAQLFKDANVNYVYSDTEGTGSLNLQFEEVIAKNQHVDFWLNVTGTSLKEVENSNAKYTLFDAFKKKNVYTYTSNGNCFWEETAVAPHKILADFITIFHPDSMGDNSLYYYQKLK